MRKFKKGDKVLLTKYLPREVWGIVTHTYFKQGCCRLKISEPDFLGSVFPTEDLVLEEIYYSPLYKALNEKTE